MKSPSVKVAKRYGELVRRRLIDANLLDIGLKIAPDPDGKFLYIPVKSFPEYHEIDAMNLKGALVDFSITDFEPVVGRLTLEDLLGFSPSYEVVGDIAILNSEEGIDPISSAEAILEVHKNIKVVLKPLTPVQGEFRVKNYEVISGEARTETIHREYGCSYALDLQTVYFSPRLSTERSRIASLINQDDVVVDMFAGVGSFVIPVAKKVKKVFAIDINPDAIKYMRRNIELNRIDNATVFEGDSRVFSLKLTGIADRVIMNLPHTAQEFLTDAIMMLKEKGTLHYYDICHEDDLFLDATNAIKDAAGNYIVRIDNKRKIRSYAPHQYNIVIDARIEKIAR
ncbi:MAG: class I SAM-dependent methyltransferase family protein [Halobacteriota archaeon]|nr:class I SAM-dependent methyltransferase family protein [Halobacteriota archaeon]